MELHFSNLDNIFLIGEETFSWFIMTLIIFAPPLPYIALP